MRKFIINFIEGPNSGYEFWMTFINVKDWLPYYMQLKYLNMIFCFQAIFIFVRHKSHITPNVKITKKDRHKSHITPNVKITKKD
jgi:hypothetical protein